MTTSGPALRNTLTAIAAAIAALWAAGSFAAPIVFSVGGDASGASIQATVDSFRAALGDPNNGNTPGPLPAGRREINWDGGGLADATTPPATPFNAFLNLRGAQFTTPGTGLSQAPPSGGVTDGLAGLFGNPTYGSTFGTFSPLRLFTPVGSNITDVGFFIPGSAGAVPAVVGGFGAVFTDVDLSGTTRIQYFDSNGDSLYSAFVEAGSVANASLSFLGVIFDAGEQIARVRITTGTDALGPNDNPGGGVDVVAMDDFLYREPAAIAAVPLPGTLGLLAIGLAGIACRRRRG